MREFTMTAKEAKSTGIFNSPVFHTNSAVDFGFIGISDLTRFLTFPWQYLS
jgi:hypothetical protein